MTVDIKVNRSLKRKKTIQAKFDEKKNELTINAPAGIDESRLNNFINKCLKRFEVIKANKDKSLNDKAEKIIGLYLKGFLKKNINLDISYTTDYKKTWGKCYPALKKIKINHLLKDMPDWVENFVLHHELCHLLEPNHGKRFKELENRYPRKERAIGYLIAKGIAEEEDI